MPVVETFDKHLWWLFDNIFGIIVLFGVANNRIFHRKNDDQNTANNSPSNIWRIYDKLLP